MAKITTADFKNGMNIIQDDNIYTIIEFQHVKPGKGAAFVRTKLRGLENDKNIDKTFRSGESVESVRVERHSYQFLYREGDMFVFMHQQTYEQIMLEERRVMAKEYLSDGEVCEVLVDVERDNVLYAEPPQHITTTVVDTDAGLKGDTAQGGSKPAKIESGASVNVPLFINIGDAIRVDTRSGEYIERAKS